MLISGVQKFTLLDFPGEAACIVFVPGCPFRCSFCYNSEFVLPEKISMIKESFIPEEVFLNFLKKRKGLLGGVVISGGEPTVMPDLDIFAEKIKMMGFKVKLDSNGTSPSKIQQLTDRKLLDYIAMDIKAPWSKYDLVAGVKVDLAKIKQSIDIILKSGLPHEFRSTLVDRFHQADDIVEMAKMITGAQAYYLQKFRAMGNLMNPSFISAKSLSSDLLRQKAEECLSYVKKCELRE